MKFVSRRTIEVSLEEKILPGKPCGYYFMYLDDTFNFKEHVEYIRSYLNKFVPFVHEVRGLF